MSAGFALARRFPPDTARARPLDAAQAEAEAAGAGIGCGTGTTTDLHWCDTGSAVWNNSGDTAFLLDPAGNVVDAREG